MDKSNFVEGNQYSYQGDNELLTYSGESQHHGVGVFKTEDELRIKQLEKLIAADSIALDKYKKELAQLKPTVHY